MAESIPEDVSRRYANETRRLLNEAKKRGITLRLLGAQAVREHCPNFRHLLDQIGRGYVDIDFVGISEQRKQLKQLFAYQGYEIDRQVLVAAEGRRYIFQNRNNIVVDVMIDRLDFCHVIDVKSRLDLDYPTLTLADLLLSKLQIVDIADKDLQDAIVLLLEHDVSDDEAPEFINKKYITGLLAADWGFYYTVNRNLLRLKSYSAGVDWLMDAYKVSLVDKIDVLLKAFESAQKTTCWHLRKLIGTHVAWYRQVSDRGQIF